MQALAVGGDRLQFRQGLGSLRAGISSYTHSSEVFTTVMRVVLFEQGYRRTTPREGDSYALRSRTPDCQNRAK